MGQAAFPIAIGAQAAGGLLGAFGQIREGQGANAASKYQQAVASNNKIIANRAAQDALARGQQAAFQQRASTRQLIGRQRAVAAASGVDVGAGSIADITAGTAGMGELDALTAIANAQREAAGFRTQAMNFQAEGDLARVRGRQALVSSRIGAVSTLLGSSSQVASTWYQYGGLGTTQPRYRSAQSSGLFG